MSSTIPAPPLSHSPAAAPSPHQPLYCSSSTPHPAWTNSPSLQPFGYPSYVSPADVGSASWSSPASTTMRMMPLGFSRRSADQYAVSFSPAAHGSVLQPIPWNQNSFVPVQSFQHPGGVYYAASPTAHWRPSPLQSGLPLFPTNANMAAYSNSLTPAYAGMQHPHHRQFQLTLQRLRSGSETPPPGFEDNFEATTLPRLSSSTSAKTHSKTSKKKATYSNAKNSPKKRSRRVQVRPQLLQEQKEQQIASKAQAGQTPCKVEGVNADGKLVLQALPSVGPASESSSRGRSPKRRKQTPQIAIVIEPPIDVVKSSCLSDGSSRQSYNSATHERAENQNQKQC